MLFPLSPSIVLFRSAACGCALYSVSFTKYFFLLQFSLTWRDQEAENRPRPRRRSRLVTNSFVHENTFLLFQKPKEPAKKKQKKEKKASSCADPMASQEVCRDFYLSNRTTALKVNL